VDFIETIFGLSPDGGSGAFEALLLAVLIAGICGWAMRRRLRRKFITAISRKLSG
jgi:hypothetical protein